MSGFSKTNSSPWQLQVFAVSIRKKEKWRWAKSKVEAALSGWRDGGPPPAGRKPRRPPGGGAGATGPAVHCLDVGSGVGTLSILMEQLGGNWEFTETDHAAAEETRNIVKGPVYEVDIFSPRLKANSYQLITIFDVIEHVPDPQKFMNRLAELLAPGGTLILTTPANGHGYYCWREFAKKLFIDKAAHGHIVEGFSRPQLEMLTAHAQLRLVQLAPFSFFFTEMVELAYNGAYIIKNRAKQGAMPGYNLALSPASVSDVAAHAWQLRLLKIVYPLLRSLSLLDRIIPIPPGYEWGLVARKVGTAPR